MDHDMNEEEQEEGVCIFFTFSETLVPVEPGKRGRPTKGRTHN